MPFLVKSLWAEIQRRSSLETGDLPAKRRPHIAADSLIEIQLGNEVKVAHIARARKR